MSRRFSVSIREPVSRSWVHFGYDFDELRLAAAQTQLGVLNAIDGRVTKRCPTDHIDEGFRAKAQLP